MNKDKRNIEFEEQKEESKRSFSFKSIINGNVLSQETVVKQAPFFMLLVLLALLSIANRNHAEKLVIDANNLQTEIKELRSKSISISSDLMNVSRQSEVEKLVNKNGLGLQPNKEPIKKLYLEKE